MKKFLAVLLSVLLLSGCVTQTAENGKVNIVATLFPQYDFARQIAGDKAEVELLLKPGVETHSFEPSPSDIIKISESDLFIYTSEYMEPWAEKLMGEGANACCVTDKIKHEKHGADIDAHVWTSPKNAVSMAENILNALCTLDKENTDYYTGNFNKYKEKLEKLDGDFENVINDAPVKKMAFGTKFSIHYFAERYGIEHISAFDSCGHEGEPSGKVMAEMVEAIKNEKLPAVFYGELESDKAAKAIADEAGVLTLMFHSCHNVTKDEFESGETYISLMEKNIKALEEGLYND